MTKVREIDVSKTSQFSSNQASKGSFNGRAVSHYENSAAMEGFQWGAIGCLMFVLFLCISLVVAAIHGHIRHPDAVLLYKIWGSLAIASFGIVVVSGIFLLQKTKTAI